MSELIELFANTRPNRWWYLERAVELIEARRGDFTISELHRALNCGPRGYVAIVQAVRVLLSHGLLIRTGKSGSSNQYRVHPAHVAVGRAIEVAS